MKTAHNIVTEVRNPGPLVTSIALAKGVKLEYVKQGPETGVPLIFLHGVTDSWRSFDGVLARLPSSVRAFAISQRGHGDSSRPATGYRYADMADDLQAFMETLRLPPAIVVGHSMGSMVAQRFAVDHPAHVAGLVLMGGWATLYGHESLREFFETVIRPMTDPIAPSLAREFQVSTLAREIPSDVLDTAVNESLKVPVRVWRDAFNGFLTTPDFSSELGKVTVPVLIAWGDRDNYASREDQDGLLAAIPSTRLVVYQGAGHTFHWEDPARFVSDLLTFTTEVTPTGKFV